MALVIGFLLALLSLLILVYPFLKTRVREMGVRHANTPEELAHTRQGFINEMERLKADLDANDITVEEYQQRTAVLRRLAAAALRSEEEAKAGFNEALPLEDLDKEVEERIRLLRRSPPYKDCVLACPECGRPPEPRDESCSSCGAALASSHSSQGGD